VKKYSKIDHVNKPLIHIISLTAACRGRNTITQTVICRFSTSIPTSFEQVAHMLQTSQRPKKVADMSQTWWIYLNMLVLAKSGRLELGDNIYGHYRFIVNPVI